MGVAFNRDSFTSEAKELTDAWRSSWVNFGTGPSAGGRRDVTAIGIIHRGDDFMQAQRSAYNNMLEYFATSMILAHIADEREVVLKGVHRTLNSVIGGSNYTQLRIETLDDIFLRTMELLSTVGTISTIDGIIDLQSRKFQKVMGFGYLDTE